MPNKKSSKKVVRRRGNAQARLPLYRGMRNVRSVMPGRFVVTLPYAEQFTLTTVSGVPGYTIYKANSCYDPDTTGVGHQPRGLDQYFNLYNHGRVLKSWFKITGSALSSNTEPVIFSAVCATNTTALATNDIMESPRSRWTVIGLASGTSVKTLTMSHYPKESFNNFSGDEEIFTPAADVNYLTNYIFQVENAAGSTATQAIRCCLTIWYTVEFTDFSLPTQS